jgi:hypothetical protein
MQKKQLCLVMGAWPPTTLMRPSTANDTRAAEELNRTIREEDAVATWRVGVE